MGVAIIIDKADFSSFNRGKVTLDQVCRPPHHHHHNHHHHCECECEIPEEKPDPKPGCGHTYSGSKNLLPEYRNPYTFAERKNVDEDDYKCSYSSKKLPNCGCNHHEFK